MDVLKIKKVLSFFIAYVLLLSVVPLNFLESSVKAAEVSSQSGLYQVKDYDTLFGGYMDKLNMYGNYGLLDNGRELYMVKDNYCRVAYASNYYIEGFPGVKGDTAYLYSSSNEIGKNVIAVDLKTFKNQIINLPSIDKKAFINSSVIDRNGGLWFSFTTGNDDSSYAYSILRLDPVTAQTKEINLDASKISNLGKLVTDNDGSVWYKTENNLDNTQTMVKLTFDNDISSTAYGTNTRVNRYNYTVNNGDVWFKGDSDSNYYFNQLTLKNGVFDKSNSIKVAADTSILVDNNGALWSNENTDGIHKISKLENGEFNPKYITTFGSYGQAFVADDNHVFVANTINTKWSYAIGYKVIGDENKTTLSEVTSEGINKNITEIQSKIKELTETLNDYVSKNDIKGIQDTQKELNSNIDDLSVQLKMNNQLFDL